MLSLLHLLFRRRLAAAPAASPVRNPRASQAPSCDQAQADFIILAAGLHQLLAKWPAGVAARNFPAARRASQALRVQARLQMELSLPAQLLSDLCHEIAVHVDVSVRQAAVRCLRHQAGIPVAQVA